MRPFLAGLSLLAFLAAAPLAEARDTDYKLKIDEVLHNPEFKQKLGSDVAFYFADGKTPAVGQKLGDYVAHRRTNSIGRPDEEACRWAMLSALIELRDRAQKTGANAVVNIVSYYDDQTFASRTAYDCHAGAIIAGVALKGTMVKLKSSNMVKLKK